MRVNRQGIDLCPRCKGRSQIEDVAKAAGYIRRLRGCQSCGNTWSTAEVGLAKLRGLLKLETKILTFAKELK